MSKKFSKKYLGIAAVVIGLLSLAAGTAPSLFEMSKNIDIYTSIYRELNTYYVDEVDPNKLMREGVDAMLESLDPYTTYISEAEMENHRFQMTGKYGGIGAIIRKMGDYVTIVEPYEGFAAQKAGLQAGDRILQIDGKDAKDKTTDEISDILRGSPSSSVVIRIERPYADPAEFDVELQREEIKVENVPYYGRVRDDIGYIRLTQFTENAGRNVANALKDMESQGDLNGVILDLRGNPGGLLREAVNVSNVFVPKNELIVTTRGKVREWDRSFKTLNAATDTEIPVIVLTSRGSASASEIVAGVIQDLDRGLVIGQRTFGKGLVQTTRDIPYKTKLKVTSAKYYTPSGRCIQAINYSDRDEDGAVGKIPDSLMTEFQTRAGRTVYDGGGVQPDVAIEIDEYAQVTIELIRKNHIFHYATKFANQTESIADAMEFEISDQTWSDFKGYLADKDLDYTTESEKLLDKLSEVSEEERYHSSIESEIALLREKIASEKETDIDKFRDEISQELMTEIVGRYHYQQGTIESSFSYDPALKSALEYFDDAAAYNELLQP
jgi:carboxyl-terminal processing protease